LPENIFFVLVMSIGLPFLSVKYDYYMIIPSGILSFYGQIWVENSSFTPTMVGQLAASVSHERDNPIGIILCYANLLRQVINVLLNSALSRRGSGDSRLPRQWNPVVHLFMSMPAAREFLKQIERRYCNPFFDLGLWRGERSWFTSLPQIDLGPGW
jgi:signal transduction histidine kinase